MDLQTIRNKLHLKQYQNREDFLFDVNQIVKNSSIYNGKNLIDHIFILLLFILLYYG